MRGEHTQTDSGGGDITQYTWDHRNRLVKVEHRASYAAAVDKVVEYAYDYQNRWVRKRLDADRDGHTDQRRLFAYDGNQIVMDFWRANSGDLEIGHLRERYLWGPAVDQILAEEEVDGGTADLVAWTLTDHLNTVRDIAKYDPLTDTTTVVNHLVYDAFGRVTLESNPAVDSLFLFTARPLDADTGLQNNLNRWYDPAVGRWLSEDPIGFTAGDENLYRYVGNSGLRYTDPAGEDWLDCMADCVADNDPAKLAAPYAVKVLLLTFGVHDKTVVASIFRLIGQDRLAETIMKMKRAPGQKEITNLLSVLATQLRNDAHLAKRVLRIIGDTVTQLEFLYGMSLAYVEAYCCTYCTTRWWYGNVEYDPNDNILDAVSRYYFPY